MKEEKYLNVMIRNVDTGLTTDQIKADLKEKGFIVREIHRLKKGGENIPIVKIRIPKDQTKIYNLRTIEGFKVRTEPQRKRQAGRAQCKRYQHFGHVATNCFADPRCVK